MSTGAVLVARRGRPGSQEYPGSRNGRSLKRVVFGLGASSERSLVIVDSNR